MVERARVSGFVPVGIATTQLLDPDPSREKFIVTNDGANDIYVQLQTGAPRNDDGTVNWPVAVVGQGILLKANGGSWTEDSYYGPLSAIAKTAPTNLCIVEM